MKGKGKETKTRRGRFHLLTKSSSSTGVHSENARNRQ